MIKVDFCHLCNSHKNLQRHHIIPYKDGGRNDIDNIIVLCERCHHPITLLFTHHWKEENNSAEDIRGLENNRRELLKLYYQILGKKKRFRKIKLDNKTQKYQKETKKLRDQIRKETIEFLRLAKKKTEGQR